MRFSSHSTSTEKPPLDPDVDVFDKTQCDEAQAMDAQLQLRDLPECHALSSQCADLELIN